MSTKKLARMKAELERRKTQHAKTSSTFDMEKFCFKDQLSFFRGDGPRFRTAVCSRRSGKTVGIVADAFDTCIKEPNSTILYITVTKENARNIIWGDIIKLRNDFNIQCELDNLRLHVKFPNGSRIVCAGAKDRTEIEKYRGWKLKKCYLDECQSFRSYISTLVNDILTPALRDLRGSLYLTGTPGPVQAGYFYECSHSDFWNNFKWTAFDNPHMHNPENGLDLEETLTEERQMKGIDASDPSYIRETYGKWIEDQDSLVFKFGRKKNVYNSLPNRKYDYIFGIDIGYNDSDAIAVLAYDLEHKDVFLVEEIVRNKQGITELVEDVKRLQAKYDPIKMVMDAGALGKKIQEEIKVRHHLHIDAAEKTRKVEFIELLNDDLRTGKLKSFEESIFQDDCMLVQWDKESILRNPESPKISNTYHSDICDAVLYAWRACKHFMAEAPKKTLSNDTDLYMKELEEREAMEMEERKLSNGLDPSDDDMRYIYGEFDDY
jgi:hypothetical protein